MTTVTLRITLDLDATDDAIAAQVRQALRVGSSDYLGDPTAVVTVVPTLDDDDDEPDFDEDYEAPDTDRDYGVRPCETDEFYERNDAGEYINRM